VKAIIEIYFVYKNITITSLFEKNKIGTTKEMKKIK